MKKAIVLIVLVVLSFWFCNVPVYAENAKTHGSIKQSIMFSNFTMFSGQTSMRPKPVPPGRPPAPPGLGRVARDIRTLIAIGILLAILPLLSGTYSTALTLRAGR